jgi:hypothetical protein
LIRGIDELVSKIAKLDDRAVGELTARLLFAPATSIGASNVNLLLSWRWQHWLMMLAMEAFL